MDHPEIFITGRSAIPAIMRTQSMAKDIVQVISINGNEADYKTPPELVGIESPVLSLAFDDVPRIMEGCIAPTYDDVKKIVDVARALIGRRGILLTHCFAGVSRSGAAGVICLATWRREDPLPIVDISIRKLFESFHITPNRRMIQAADRILGYGGWLSGIVQRYSVSDNSKVERPEASSG